jgi:hypothetical protein
MIKDSYGNTRFFGTYRGIVVDNADPLGRNRLRLKVPQILGDLATEWAWAVIPSGVSFSVPAIGDGVWVQFEGGDASFPIWVGAFEATAENVNVGPAGPTGPAGSTSTATGVSTTTSNFNNILSSADDTVQKALDTLDNYTPAAISLDGLSDVAISSAVTGQVVRYNGTSWENYELASMAIDHTSSLNFGNGSGAAAPIPLNSSLYAIPSTSWTIAATYYSFQVPQVGIYEFSYVGTGTSINSNERAVIGLYSGSTSSTVTTQFRELKSFASVATAMTVGLNAKWIVNVTSTSTYWAFKTWSSNGSGTLSANGTVLVRRIH